MPVLTKMTTKQLLDKVNVLPGMYLWKGDVYSEEIINRGDVIVPELIEAVLDERLSNVESMGGAFNYFVGDVAVWLLNKTATKKNYLQQYFYDEYKGNLGTPSNVAFPQTYNIFLYESFVPEKSNKKNRMKLYNYLKKWYKVNYRNGSK